MYTKKQCSLKMSFTQSSLWVFVFSFSQDPAHIPASCP